MNPKFPFFKEKCPHCSVRRIFIKSVPLVCPCQWLKVKDHDGEVTHMIDKILIDKKPVKS